MWHNQVVQNLDPGVDYPQLGLDLQLCFPLYAVSRAVTSRYAQLLGEVGLTYPQYLVMLALWEAGSLGVGELGERLRLDSGTLSPLLKRLQASGVVTRTRDAHDERRVVVAPTDAGWQLRGKVAHVPAAIAQAMGLEPQAYAELKQRLAELLCSLDLATT